MFKSYLKILMGNFAAQRLNSLINVLGLSISLTCCLLIFLFILHEFGYDRYYANAERIHRLEQRMDTATGDGYSRFIPPVAADLLQEDFPRIEDVARLSYRNTSIGDGAQSHLEMGLAFADPSLFKLFDFTWLAGDPDTALSEPASIVLTESLARKYFGEDPALGGTLTLENRIEARVTGVIADLPSNTHFEFTAIASYPLYPSLLGNAMSFDSWGFMAANTYVLLEEGVPPQVIQSRLPEFAARHISEESSRAFRLKPLTAIHMSRDSQGGVGGLDNAARVGIFAAIAFCILTIAVINFMNLSIAQSFRRAREVGVRLSVGGARWQIVRQIVGEAVFMVGCAMLVALALAELLLPLINGMLGIDLALATLSSGAHVAGLLAAVVLIGGLAGSYPALYLSSYQPARVLKGELTRGTWGVRLRGILVVFQFAVSIVLLVATLGVFQQMQYTRSMDMGYDREQLLTLALPDREAFDVNRRWQGFKNRMLDHSQVLSVTHSLTSPLQEGGLRSSITRAGGSGDTDVVLVPVEASYFDTYRIPLRAGRYFSPDRGEDVIAGEGGADDGAVRGSLVLSEMAARQLGWTPEQAVGQEATLGYLGQTVSGPVVGVAGNTLSSAKHEVLPLVYITPENFRYGFIPGRVAVRISGTALQQTLQYMDAVWREFMPGAPVTRQFIDEQIEAFYQQERMQMRFFSFSAFLSVLIACLGLYGLAVFNVEHRAKEIGVRKVMGSNVWNIVLLFTNDFSKLVLLANVIAWPVAWFAINRWLENFAFRIDLTPLIFIGSGLIALCIAWVTVGGTAAKAANANPVLALRDE